MSPLNENDKSELASIIIPNLLVMLIAIIGLLVVGAAPLSGLFLSVSGVIFDVIGAYKLAFTGQKWDGLYLIVSGETIMMIDLVITTLEK